MGAIKEILSLRSEGSFHRGSPSFGKAEGMSKGIGGDPVLDVWRTRQSRAGPAGTLPGQGPVGSRAREKHSALKQLFPPGRKPPQSPHSSRSPPPAPHIRGGSGG